eukprot:2254142-Lingulodinium_polyedra.AAC.1
MPAYCPVAEQPLALLEAVQGLEERLDQRTQGCQPAVAPGKAAQRLRASGVLLQLAGSAGGSALGGVAVRLSMS